MRILWTGRFKKDYKLAKKQGKDLDELRSVVEKLAARQALAPKYKDHSLSGRWHKHRDCHIASDWVLIYRVHGEDLILERMGSHSELFKK